MFCDLLGGGSENGVGAEKKALQAAITALHDLIPSDGDYIEHQGLYLVAVSWTKTVVVKADGERESASRYWP